MLIHKYLLQFILEAENSRYITYIRLVRDPVKPENGAIVGIQNVTFLWITIINSLTAPSVTARSQIDAKLIL